jgi:hypothetical protein
VNIGIPLQVCYTYHKDVSWPLLIVCFVIVCSRSGIPWRATHKSEYAASCMRLNQLAIVSIGSTHSLVKRSRRKKRQDVCLQLQWKHSIVFEAIQRQSFCSREMQRGVQHLG